MHIIKEGLEEYLLLEDVKNNYYLDVEYPLLRHNVPDGLLKVQIRDVNGSRKLLYQITGMISLEKLLKSEGHTVTGDEIKGFLTALGDLLDTLDQFMLDIRQVSFSPAMVFVDRKRRFCWLYSPVKEEEPAKKIEGLFEKLLSFLDYSDIAFVQFAYHAYWCIRNDSLTQETISRCLSYESREPEEKKRVSYEEFFQEGSPIETGKEASFERDYLGTSIDRAEVSLKAEEAGRPEKQPGAPSFFDSARFLLAFEISCLVLLAAFLAAFVFFAMLGWQQGILVNQKLLLAGFLLAALAAGEGFRQIHRRRKRQEAAGICSGAKREVPPPVYNYSWEEEGGTEVLGIRKNMLQPALKNTVTEEIHILKDFPYYIGADPDINQLSIKDSSISRRHAVLIRGRQTGNYELQDLQSTNGSWVNHKPLTYEKPIRLEPGDQIQFARQCFTFIMLDCPMGEYGE